MSDVSEETWGLNALGKGADNVFVELHERLDSPDWQLQIEMAHVTVAFPVEGPDAAVQIGRFISEHLGRTKWRPSDDGERRVYSMVAELIIVDTDDAQVTICKSGEFGDRFVVRMCGPSGSLHANLHEPEISALNAAFSDLENDIGTL